MFPKSREEMWRRCRRVSKAGTGCVLTPCPYSRRLRPGEGAPPAGRRSPAEQQSSWPAEGAVLCGTAEKSQTRSAGGLEGKKRAARSKRPREGPGGEAGRGRGASVRRAPSGHAPATTPRTGRRGWVPDREGSGGSRQVRGPQGHRPASARTSRPGPPAPNPCPERENAPFSTRHFNRSARGARAWAKRVPYPGAARPR